MSQPSSTPYSHLVNRRCRKLAKLCHDQGWRVRKGGHGVITYPPGTDSIIAIPSTPSDHRAIKNIEAQLSRAGLEI